MQKRKVDQLLSLKMCLSTIAIGKLLEEVSVVVTGLNSCGFCCLRLPEAGHRYFPVSVVSVVAAVLLHFFLVELCFVTMHRQVRHSVLRNSYSCDWVCTYFDVCKLIFMILL